ncbi:MAG: TonB-dependent receptor, partial [Burkholderiales bacterium]
TGYTADQVVPSGELAPVVVTATRFPDIQRQFPIGVSVIDREAIVSSTARSVPELLSLQAGIQVRDSTGSPDLQIDMRGFGQTGDLNTTVLVDGQRFNDIDTSPLKWSAIPLSAIERIEILPGSGAVIYGSGATGGVINIITRQPVSGDRKIEVQVGSGSYDASDLQVAASLAGDRLGLRIQASDQRSDNYRENNRLTQRNLLADVRTLGAGPKLYMKLASDAQDLRNPGQLTLSEMAVNRRGTQTPRDFSSRDGVRADLGGSVRSGNVEWAANLAYRTQETRAFFSAFSSEVVNETENIAFSPRLKFGHRFGGPEQTLIAGIDVEEGNLDRNVTGVFFYGRSKARQQKSGIYLQNNAALGRDWLLTVGARGQHAENAVDDVASFGSLLRKTYSLSASEVALRYRVSDGVSLYGKTGRSFRLPSVEETNFTSPALLEPQTSRDREAGINYRTGGTSTRLAVYRIDLENEIAFNPLVFDNINLSPTRREGVELEARTRVTPTLDLFLTHAHVLARFRNGIYGGTDLAGKTVPLVPRNALNVGVSWLTGSKTRLSATLRHVGEQRLVNDETNTQAQLIPAYTVVDLRLAQQMGGWMLEAGVRNLFNREYYTQGGVSDAGVVRVFPAAKRNGYVSVQYSFR